MSLIPSLLSMIYALPLTLASADSNGVVTVAKRIRTGVNNETITGTKNLVKGDKQTHNLIPSGANRDVVLYASPSEGDYHIIRNKGTSGYNLVLKNNGGTTLVTIGNGVAVAVEYDGVSAWDLT